MPDFSYVESLPDINFINTSVEALLSEAITVYQNTYNELTGESITIAPGDDVYILLYAEALRQYSILQTINASARQNLLKYATGDYLKHLGSNTGNVASEPKAAVCTLLFTLPSVQTSDVVIPKGTRATPGNGVFFASDAVATIPAGSLTVSQSATCTKTGTSGNGYVAGQISTLVDTGSFAGTVSNTDTSSGGSGAQSEASFKEQIFASPSGYSVAGPASAYEYFTRKYSAAIIDVFVESPSAGAVDVYVLLTGGTLPGSTLLAEIEDYLETYRPLTDDLTVKAPTTTPYDITLTYYIDSSNSGNAATIQAAVTAAITTFTTWTRSKIGRDMIPDQLIAKIIAAGAKRVVLTAPAAYAAVDDSVIAVPGTVATTYGGLE